MSFHLRLKAAVGVACLAAVCMTAAPSLAQNRAADLCEQVGAFVQPSNAARLDVLLRQLREEGFAPTVETFEGGGQTGRADSSVQTKVKRHGRPLSRRPHAPRSMI